MRFRYDNILRLLRQRCSQPFGDDAPTGANAQILNKKGETALSATGSEEMKQILIACGAVRLENLNNRSLLRDDFADFVADFG